MIASAEGALAKIQAVSQPNRRRGPHDEFHPRQMRDIGVTGVGFEVFAEVIEIPLKSVEVDLEHGVSSCGTHGDRI
ncbi:MAG: hypothetical protein ACJAYU_002141 [Bradymonadia bacterium]